MSPAEKNEIRQIVREENLRCLRLSLAIAEQMRLGYIVSPDMLNDPPVGVTVSGLQLDVLNYKEGR